MSPGFSVYGPLLIQRIRAIDAKPDAVLAPSSGEKLASPRRRASVACVFDNLIRAQVSSFSNWGKAASPEKLKHEAAVSRLCRNQPVRRVIFLDGVEDDAMIQHERAVKF